MSKRLSKSMRLSRKLRVTSGIGEAWYYIDHGGMNVFVARERGQSAANCFTISASKMRRALAIIDRERLAADKEGR